jgi:hypothetical protein
MRCFLRNAGTMLAMIWSAAVARAGPVHIRPTFDFSPAAIEQPQAEPVGELVMPLRLSLTGGEANIAWFPEIRALEPGILITAAPGRPAAIMIPLPAPAWLAVVGLGVYILARRIAGPISVAN